MTELNEAVIVEPVSTPPTPEATFADHVATVRERGDVAEQMKAYRLGSTLLHFAAPFAAIGFVGEGTNLTAGIATAGASMAASGYMFARRRRSNQGASREMSGKEAQATIGEAYELYRVPRSRYNRLKKSDDPTIDLYWEPGDVDGSEDPKALRARLARLTQMAAKQDIRCITMRSDAANRMGLDTSTNMYTDWKWHRRQKKGLGTTPLLYTHTPEGILQLLREKDTQELGVDELVAKLRRLGGQHAIIRASDYWEQVIAGAKPGLRDKLTKERTQHITKAAYNTLKDDLSERVAEGINLRRIARDTEKEPIYKRPVYYRTAHVTAQTTTWEVDQQHEDRMATLEALRLTEQQLEQLIAHPHTDPHAARKALAFAILRAAQKDLEPAIMAEPKMGEGAAACNEDDRMAMPQEHFARIAEHPYLFGKEEPRYTVGVIAAVLVLASSIVGTTAIERQRESQAADIRAVLAAREGLTQAEIPASSVNRELHRKSLGWLAWDEATKARSYFTYLPSLKFGRFNHNDSSGNALHAESKVSDEQESRVGNVTNGSSPSVYTNHADWEISAHGVEPRGFWATGTGDALDTFYHSGHASFSWANSSVKGGTPTSLPLPTAALRARPYLDVSAPVSPDSNYISIPVRDGTKPIAATMDGKPLTLIQNADGSYGLQAKQPKTSGYLEYLLAPTAQPQDSIHAAHPLHIDTSKLHLRSDFMNRFWQYEFARHGQVPPTDPLARTRAAANLINKNWDYALNPLPDSGMVESFAQFVDESATVQKANCNTTSTLLSFIDYRNNVAFGYENSGSDPTKLSSHEGHQVIVTPSGEIIDGTPSKVSPQDAAYFNEDYTAPPQHNHFPLPPVVPTSLVAGALVMGFWRRRDPRRLYQGARVQWAYRAQRQLDALDEATLRRDKAIVNDVSFAPSFDLQASIRRASQDKTSGPEAQAQLNLLASRSRERSIWQMTRSTESGSRSALQHAAKTLALARRAQYTPKRGR